MAICSTRSTILLSLVILLLAAFLLAIRGLNVAVDFTGGMIIQVHYPEAIASKSVQETLAQAGFSGNSVKEITGYNFNVLIALPPKEDVLPPRLV
jgi:preprotein translocase subunit SecF